MNARDPPLRHQGLSVDEPPRRAAARQARRPAAQRASRAKTAQIVPSASIAGNALIVVIAIMSFLACLTAGAVYMVNQSANAWVNDISSEITVELDPVNTADIEKKITLVSLFLAKQKGVTRVKPITAEDSAKLLEPWLGQTSALQALPIPRLIAVEIDRSNPPDIQVIKTALTQNFEGVTLDDHRRWQAEIRTLTRSAALGGLAVLVARRRRNHRRDHLGDAERHGLEPRDHRGAAFRRRQRTLHQP